nr:MAG TPA_asm: hypothetical protein [Caudoviricetes sp.]
MHDKRPHLFAAFFIAIRKATPGFFMVLRSHFSQGVILETASASAGLIKKCSIGDIIRPIY